MDYRDEDCRGAGSQAATAAELQEAENLSLIWCRTPPIGIFLPSGAGNMMTMAARWITNGLRSQRRTAIGKAVQVLGG
jgi:hypothetical protein